jgi:hypothetical protein
MFFVSAESKGLSGPISSLDATLARYLISVDSARLRRARGRGLKRLRDAGNGNVKQENGRGGSG